MMFMAPPLARLALKFDRQKIFPSCFWNDHVIYLASESMVKSLIMGGIRTFSSCIGTDAISGQLRYTLGITGLWDGLGLVPVCHGLFGISEILSNIERAYQQKQLSQVKLN